MKAFQRSAGAIAKINVQLFGVLFYALAAFYCWPSAPEYWGFGFISIISGAAAFAVLIQAMHGMVTLYLRDKTLADYEAQAKPQKNADMASDDALRKAGVIDG